MQKKEVQKLGLYVCVCFDCVYAYSPPCTCSMARDTSRIVACRRMSQSHSREPVLYLKRVGVVGALWVSWHNPRMFVYALIASTLIQITLSRFLMLFRILFFVIVVEIPVVRGKYTTSHGISSKAPFQSSPMTSVLAL